MLEVFLKLREKFDDIQLTICGTGDPEGDYFLDMKKSVHTSKYKNDVSLFINQPLQQMSALYQDHDIFVLPTRHDPASFTVLEAMAHGLVVLTTSVDGAEGYIEEGINGFVFDHKSNKKLEFILSELMNNRPNIINIAKSSIDIVINNHNLSLTRKIE